MKIGRRLGFGIGIIIFFLLALGVVAWLQTDSLWQNTKSLYEHPLMVRRALGDIKSDILTMDGRMKDLLLVDAGPARTAIIGSIDSAEADALRRFEIVFDRFLGSMEDAERAFGTFVEWKAVRSETIALIQSGEMAEAKARYVAAGVERVYAEKTIASLKILSDFSERKGDQFYLDSLARKNMVIRQLVILSAIILALSFIIGYTLRISISVPIGELTDTTERYRKGDQSVRSGYSAADEIGSLAASFNALAETVQTETQAQAISATIAQVMLGEEEPDAFFKTLLAALVEQTDSRSGAIYLLSADRTVYELAHSIGLDERARNQFTASDAPGELGRIFTSRSTHVVKDIPADTKFIYSAVSGEMLPREIMTIPILSGDEIVAVISLASLKEYPAHALRLVRDVHDTLTARLLGVLAFGRMQDFSRRLELVNRELEEQKRELGAQAGELSEQNRELERQKIELDESNTLKSTFLSNMSHELRTPLNSVIALSGVLGRKLKGLIPDQEYSWLEVIERNGKNLLRLINDILDLSRIESGKEELSFESFSVMPIIADIIEMLETQAREKNILLVDSLPPDTPRITGDAWKFRHIMQNIVGNAVKFTDSGSVTISVVASPEGLRLSVRDTGIGIAKENLPFIFDEFRQADESTSRRYGGSGLGLAIARKYARLMHGDIEVQSALGVGSTFTVILPLSGERADEIHATSALFPVPEMKSEPIADRSEKGVDLLLVEDSEPAIIQLRDILDGQGYSLSVAHDGREALEMIGRSLPDAMILDLMMPEVDGFEVLRAVRGREETRCLPILILTARHVSKEELSFLKGNHIGQLIQKGDIGREELLRAIRRLILPEEHIQVRHNLRSQTGGKPLVLVVEDNEDNMTTVKAVLGQNYALLEAVDGVEGLARARESKPDLILLDISLPGMDGFAVLDSIRSDVTLRNTPVIALTAKAMKGDRQEILGRGFDEYVSKPIDAKTLVLTLSEFLHEA